MEQLFGSDNFNVLPHAVALLIAYVLAFPLGWNREKEERSAGLRTFPLVAIACCGLIQAAELLTADNPEAMARIIEGLITGMGFIGGGAILRLKDRCRAPPPPPASGSPARSASPPASAATTSR